MSLYSAIDLHSNNNVLAILDEADQPIRLKRLPNETKGSGSFIVSNK